jgi:Icc-related predicted phosphoesterase
MKLLLFSDLHSDYIAAARLVERSRQTDLVVAAGDLCIARRGLEKIVGSLSDINKPTVLVPGNSESAEELKKACRSWKSAIVLHGSQTTIDGISFYGIGGGIPVTPFGSWSYDFTEDQAATLLQNCPCGGVLVSHSPPKGFLDVSSDGRRLGSAAVRQVLETKKPDLVVCGHIHASAGQIDRLDQTTVINAGPDGMIWDLA